MIVLILKAILKDNTIQLVIYILMFTMGFGAGGAIADAINGWGKEKKDEVDNGRGKFGKVGTSGKGAIGDSGEIDRFDIHQKVRSSK